MSALAVSLPSSFLETLSRARYSERATVASGERKRISDEEEEAEAEAEEEEETAALAAVRPRRNDRGISSSIGMPPLTFPASRCVSFLL